MLPGCDDGCCGVGRDGREEAAARGLVRDPVPGAERIWIAVAEAVRRCGVSRQTLYNWWGLGKIRSRLRHGQRLFLVEDLDLVTAGGGRRRRRPLALRAWLTPSEASGAFDVPLDTLYGWLRRRVVRCRRTAGHWQIDRAALEERLGRRLE